MQLRLAAIMLTLTLSFILLAPARFEINGTSTSSQVIATSGSILQSTTYFNASFSKFIAPTFGLNTDWPSTEPCSYPNEKGVWQWVNAANYNGNMKLVQDPVNANLVCLQMILDASETRPLFGNQEVKLYNIQDQETQNWGIPYKNSKEAYYKMQYYFPANLQVSNWRLIWQICGDTAVYGNSAFANTANAAYPQLQLTFGSNSLEFETSPFYNSNGQWGEYPVISTANLPKDQWVTITIYVKQGTTFQSQDGTVQIWINNNLMFTNTHLPTATYTGTPYVIWGIGNYGSQYEAKDQYINIKDVTVTSTYPPN